MKTFATLTAAGALLAAVIGTADAADLYNGGGGSTKDGPTAANFSGGSWYAAAGIGGSLTDTNVGATGGPAIGDFNFSGIDADFVAGYDYKVSQTFLVGGRLGIGIQDVKGDIFGTTGNQTWNYEVAGRLGYVAHNVGLIYLGGGWKWQHVGLNLTGFATDLNGPELFGGLEIDLAGFTGRPGLFLQAESAYTWFGNWTPGRSGLTISDNEFTQKARIGLRF